MPGIDHGQRGEMGGGGIKQRVKSEDGKILWENALESGSC